MKKKLTFLGIETSCDETAASIVRETEDGLGAILSNIVSSQVEEHKKFGGIVPELAARAHAEKIDLIINEAIKKMLSLKISQIPIFDDNKPVGIVSEEGLARLQLANSANSQLKKTHLEDVMTDVPPIINYDTPANTLGPLLQVTKCILVSKNSKPFGIITATDLLQMI